MTQPDPVSLARAALEMSERATPGPWSCTPADEPYDVCLFVASGDWLANVGNWARGQDPFTHAQPETIEIEHVANAALIVFARNNLPALARAVLALSALVKQARPWIQMELENAQDGGDFNECRDWLAACDAALAAQEPLAASSMPAASTGPFLCVECERAPVTEDGEMCDLCDQETADHEFP